MTIQKNSLHRLIGVAFLAPLFTATWTTAADADPADTGSTGGSSVRLQAITVTATKRTEKIQDIPTSVSAVDGDSLLEHHVQSYEDITRTVPGISFQEGTGPGQSNIEIRGVSSTSGSATVGIYIDEVSITTKNTYDGAVEPKLFDLERVEVLRGPQGTLFGASSMGGTIRFITKQPDVKKYSASGSIDASTTKHGGFNYDTNAVLNIPVVEGSFGLRLGVDLSHESGYIDHYIGTQTGIPPGGNATNGNLLTLNTNDSTGVLGKRGVNSNNVQVVKLAGRWLASDSLTVTPAILYQRTKVDDSGIFYPSLGLYQQDKRVAEPATDTVIVPSLTIEKNLGFADLTSVTSYFSRQFDHTTDGTYYNDNVWAFFLATSNDPVAAGAFGLPTNPLPPALAGQAAQLSYQTQGVIGFLPSQVNWKTNTRQFSEELRLASRDASVGGMPLTWVGGLYFSDSRVGHLDDEPSPGLVSAFNQIYPGLSIDQSALGSAFYPGVSYAGDVIYFAHSHSSERQFAPFGEVGLKITPDLKVAAGLRYVVAHQNYDFTSGGYFAYGLPNPYSDAEKFTATTPKISVDYKISENSNVYASASKGFRLGGPTGPDPANVPGASCNPDYANLGITGAPLKYDSDSLWSYELGSKGRYFDNRVSINAAIYAIKWSNIQQTVGLPTCGFGFTTNAGDANSFGSEIEIRALVTDSLALSLNGGTTHAYFTRSNEAGVFEVGESILNVPEYTATVAADYDAEIADGYQGFARVDYAYTGQSHAYFNSSSVQNHFSPSYGVLGASFGVTHGKLSFSLYAKNLLDNKKIIQYPSINTVQEGYTLRPLTIGAVLSLQM